MIADDADRQLALDPTRSFIVQAPAGSGKTELLTRRILTLLLRVEQPESVLAITFTRKAAVEMRHRVVSLLQAAADKVPVESDYEHASRELALSVLQHDAGHEWHLLNNPQRLNIQTIDSLCAVLTRQMPVTAGFGVELSVREDARTLYEAAAKRCIETALQDNDAGGHSLKVLLNHVDNNVDRLRDLLAVMLGNRDQWLRHYAKGSARDALQQDLDALLETAFNKLGASVPSFFPEQVLPLLQYADRCLDAAGSDKKPAGLNGIQSLAELPVPSLHQAMLWQAIATVLLTKDGGLRKRLTKGEGFPANPADVESLGLTKPALKAEKDRAMTLLSELSDHPHFTRLLSEAARLPVAGYSGQQLDIIDALLELLLFAVAELQWEFSLTRDVDFSEIAMRASRALGRDGEPTDLALSLDYRIQHMLVDEFQDTSISQFNLFKQLVQGWENFDGRTFFAVGDPMQSIYRFRDAEVGLFLQAAQTGVGAVSLEPLTLSVNFRSDPAIVDWCNTAFSNIFPEQPDLDTGAITYSQSSPGRQSVSDAEYPAAVSIHGFDSTDRHAQALATVQIVGDALTSNDTGNVAILVRSKSVLTEIFDALQRAGIAYQAIDIETLGDRLVVKDILSLARALMVVQDRVHWLAVLRAPFCGLTLDDLYRLAGTEGHTALWTRLNDAAVVDTLSPDGQQRVSRLLGVLTPAMYEASRSSLVRWVESVWLELGGPASYRGLADVGASEACFQELARIEAAGLLWDFSYVSDRMVQLFAPSLEGPDAETASRVQIMTIHKSKGLEFDTVVLPQIGARARGDVSQLLNWVETVDGDNGRLVLAPIPETNIDSKHDPILQLVKKSQRLKSDNELLRLLYVASTRARSALHLIGHTQRDDPETLKLPERNSLLYPLWPVVADEFTKQVNARADDVAESIEQTQAVAVGEQGDLFPQALSATDDMPGENMPLENLSEANGYKVNGHKAYGNEANDDEESNIAPPFVRLTSGWTPPDLRAQWFRADTTEPSQLANNATGDAVEFEWASTTARHIGTVVHRQIQRLAESHSAAETAPTPGADSASSPTARRSYYETQLSALGVAPGDLPKAVKRVQDSLTGLVNDARCQWLLGNHQGSAVSEYRLTGVIDGQLVSGIVDRTFVDDDGSRWIIDFKTGDHRGGDLDGFLDNERERYEPQLSRYAAIMSALEHREIKLGLYYPLLGGWREWLYQPEQAAGVVS